MPKLGDFRVEISGTDTLTPATKKARQSTEELSKSAGRLKGSLTAVGSAMRTAMPFLAGAAVVGGIYKLATGIFQTGVAFEKMQFQLRGVSKTIQEADAQFKMIREFAARTPFMTENVTQAFIMLKAVGLQPTIKQMEIFGNVAFTMGRDITDVASSIVALETEVLRRLGIQLDRTGKKAIITSGNMRVEVENSIDAIRTAVIEVWEKRYPGAMKKAEETTTGAVALMKSEWSELQDTLATFVLPEVKNIVTWLGKAIGKAREWAGMFAGESSFKKQIREDREELERLKSELGLAGAWVEGPMGGGMEIGPSPERVTEIKERMADLKAEIRLYTQHLEQADRVSKALASSTEGVTGGTGRLKTGLEDTSKAMVETADRMQKLTDMYETSKGKWVAAIEAQTVGTKTWREELEETAGSIQRLNEMYEAAKEQWVASIEAQTGLYEKMGEDTTTFSELATANLNQVQSAMQTTFSALAAGSEAWKGALIGLLSTLVHFLISKGIKKKKEMVASSTEETAKAAEAAAEYDVVGAVLHAIAAALFGTAAGAWSSVGKGHRGIPLIGGDRFPGLKADERPIIAQTGERLLSRREVAAIDGPEVVEAANRGVSIGSQSIVMTNSMGPIQNMADVEEIGVVIGEKILSTIRESA